MFEQLMKQLQLAQGGAGGRVSPYAFNPQDYMSQVVGRATPQLQPQQAAPPPPVAAGTDKPPAAEGGLAKMGMTNLAPTSLSPFAPQSLLSQMPAGAGLNLSPVQLAPQQAAPQVGGPQVQITNRQWRPRAQFGPTGYMGTTLEEPDQSGVEAAGLANMQGQMAAAGEQAKLQAASQAQGSAQQAAAAMQAQKLGVDSNSELLRSLNAGIASNNSAGITGQAHVEGAKLGADAARDAANIRAKADHGMAMGKATLDLLAGITNGTIKAGTAATIMDAIRSMTGHGPSGMPDLGAVPPGLVGPPAPGSPPAASAPPDKIAAAGSVANSERMAAGAGQSLTAGGKDVKPGAYQGADLLNRAASLDDAGFNALAEDIRGGKYGDLDSVLKAVAVPTAAAYIRAQPPTYPKGHAKEGKPIDFMREGMSQLPGSISPNIPGSLSYSDVGGGRQLLNLGVRPGGFGDKLARTIGMTPQRAGGIPYNQITLPDGRVIPVSPTEISSVFGDTTSGVAPDQLQMRGYQGDRLLRAILNLPAAGK